MNLSYTRLDKPRGGYGFPLRFHLHASGQLRGWVYQAGVPLGPIWLSTTPLLDAVTVPNASQTAWADISVQRLPGQHGDLPYAGLVLALRIGRIYMAPQRIHTIDIVRVWYTRTAHERERLIEALHQVLDGAKAGWLEYWRHHPPVPGETRQHQHTVVLPTPEEIYFSDHRPRQYAWDDEPHGGWSTAARPSKE